MLNSYFYWLSPWVKGKIEKELHGWVIVFAVLEILPTTEQSAPTLCQLNSSHNFYQSHLSNSQHRLTDWLLDWLLDWLVTTPQEQSLLKSHPAEFVTDQKHGGHVWQGYAGGWVDSQGRCIPPPASDTQHMPHTPVGMDVWHFSTKTVLSSPVFYVTILKTFLNLSQFY